VTQPPPPRDGFCITARLVTGWLKILNENRLQVSRPGTPKLSLTPERSVAEYFACNAVCGDQRDHPREESRPVLLVLDGEGLVALTYDLEDYTGDGEECEWENEIACWSAIDPLDEVLINIEVVPPQRAQPYFDLPSYEERRDAYQPVGPRLAEHELLSITQVIEQLEEGQITEDMADQTAAAIGRHRFLIRSDNGLGRPTE
jgi:hypothetical protein